MNGQPQQKMTGADLKQHHEAIKREVMRVLDDVKLRQWCVEQSVKIANDTDNLFFDEVSKITKFFYDFVTNAQEKPDAKSA